MKSWLSRGIGRKFLSFVAFKNECFIKFRNTRQYSRMVLLETLESKQYLMSHIESSLMRKSVGFCRIIERNPVNGIFDKISPYGSWIVRILH